MTISGSYQITKPFRIPPSSSRLACSLVAILPRAREQKRLNTIQEKTQNLQLFNLTEILVATNNRIEHRIELVISFPLNVAASPAVETCDCKCEQPLNKSVTSRGCIQLSGEPASTSQASQMQNKHPQIRRETRVQNQFLKMFVCTYFY